MEYKITIISAGENINVKVTDLNDNIVEIQNSEFLGILELVKISFVINKTE